jgi:hypothetical protein
LSPVEIQNGYYYFDIKDSPDDIAINPEIPEGLNYRIQIAVFRNPVAPVFFKGL